MDKIGTTADLTDGAQAVTAAMMAVNPAVTKAWMDLASEGARFLTSRLQEDIETQKALMACRTPQDLLRVQSGFFAKAMQQYSDETGRLLQMMAGATEDVMQDATSGHARKYDDIPL